MTALWYCPACKNETLGAGPWCIMCGPLSYGKVEPRNDDALSEQKHRTVAHLMWIYEPQRPERAIDSPWPKAPSEQPQPGS